MSFRVRLSRMRSLPGWPRGVSRNARDALAGRRRQTAPNDQETAGYLCQRPTLRGFCSAVAAQAVPLESLRQALNSMCLRSS